MQSHYITKATGRHNKNKSRCPFISFSWKKKCMWAPKVVFYPLRDFFIFFVGGEPPTCRKVLGGSFFVPKIILSCCKDSERLERFFLKMEKVFETAFEINIAGYFFLYFFLCFGTTHSLFWAVFYKKYKTEADYLIVHRLKVNYCSINK